MNVKVVPVQPIRGILPKNKMIMDEMILDLNKSEISYCMQFGNVYDENGNIMDRSSLKNIDTKKVIKQSEFTKKTNATPVKLPMQGVVGAPIHLRENKIKEQYVPTNMFYNLVPEYHIEDNFYILEITFKTNDSYFNKDSLYGVFNFIKGTKRPIKIEYKVKDNWNEFHGNKFADLDSLNNGDKFIFRFIPNPNNTEFNYKMSIKEDKNNNEISSITDSIKIS